MFKERKANARWGTEEQKCASHREVQVIWTVTAAVPEEALASLQLTDVSTPSVVDQEAECLLPPVAEYRYCYCKLVNFCFY